MPGCTYVIFYRKYVSEKERERKVMYTYRKKDIQISLWIKLIAVMSSVYGLVLTVRSLKTFSYFTTLSNVAIDLILLFFITADIQLLKSDGKKQMKTNFWYIVKFLLTVSITITFLVFMFILAPTMTGGIWAAYFDYYGYSFCLHFLTPFLAIVDFLFYDYDYVSTAKHVFYATIPALCYVLFVTIAGYSGVRWGNMYAPYNFLNFGAATGWFGFDLSLLGPESLGIGVAYMIVVLVIFFLILGQIFLKIKDGRRKKKYK